MGESTVFIEFMLSVIKQSLLNVGYTKPIPKKDARLDEIYKFLDKNEYVTNSNVQKLLGVSPATATRILSDFTKSGDLVRIRIKSHWGYIRK